jgi:hypothetical protein
MTLGVNQIERSENTLGRTKQVVRGYYLGTVPVVDIFDGGAARTLPVDRPGASSSGLRNACIDDYLGFPENVKSHSPPKPCIHVLLFNQNKRSLQCIECPITYMYPYYQMHHFRRGPSRLIWFILGGVTAAWWMKHKEMRSHERYMGHCVRQSIQPAEINGQQTQNTKAHWGGSAQAQYEAPRASPPPQPMPFGWNDQQWEDEKEKMWAMGRQAGDTVSCLAAPF